MRGLGKRPPLAAPSTKRRRGFTLLEVMIAVAFIGLALVAAVRTQGQGMRLSEEARFMSRAVFLAREVLADAQTASALEPGVESEAFPEPLDYLSWEREISPVPNLPGLFKVQVWVYRDGQPSREGLTLTGFAYREL